MTEEAEVSPLWCHKLLIATQMRHYFYFLNFRLLYLFSIFSIEIMTEEAEVSPLWWSNVPDKLSQNHSIGNIFLFL